jgi:hypothetical protein
VARRPLQVCRWSSARPPNTVMDPYERKAVFVAPSLVPGAGEGLFARWSRVPG